MKITIDGLKVNKNKNQLYRGNGMVSANNSSRLLLDYKSEHPEQYWKILELLFSKPGCNISYLKLEMGSDVNSSSGTEPCVKRFPEEKADVTRGVGFILASDAKKINPDLSLDMLWWSEPWWVTCAEDVYSARYDWYKSTLIAAYETYGLQFDFVSTTKNERAYDSDWIVYLSTHLKNEKDAPYDFSKIKIVVGEEVCTWNFADEANYKKDLIKYFDVIGSHYTSWSTEVAQNISQQFNKELFLSEGSSPMKFAEGSARFDSGNCGISEINGALDIATRFITMYAGGKMTMCEYQPTVASYYDGACYCHKQFILANEPWSGDFSLDLGFHMATHFGTFIEKGWCFVDGANIGDGKPGGDGHSIVDSKYNVLTVMNPSSGDFTIVVANNTKEKIDYNFELKNISSEKKLNIWETTGPEVAGKIPLKKIGEINGGKEFDFVSKPFSLTSITTVDVSEINFEGLEQKNHPVMNLPYSDDFSYKKFPSNYLSSRGNAPRYTTDQGGAFEIVDFKMDDGNVKKVLRQLVPYNQRPEEWGWTPNPVTCLGDDRWSNYCAEVKIHFDDSESFECKNYCGLATRFIFGCNGESGFQIRLYNDGLWQLKMDSKILADGSIKDFKSNEWHTLYIQTVHKKIVAKIDEVEICRFTAKNSLPVSGRVALLSSYNKNYFADLKIESVDSEQYFIERKDQTDLCVDFFGTWKHNLMSSFKNYKRTISTGREGAKLKINFKGSSINLLGENVFKNGNNGIIKIKIDGKILRKKYCVPSTSNRESFLMIKNLKNTNHKLEIKILKNKLSIDSIEFCDQ